MKASLFVENLAATEALGRTLGPLLFPGAVVALTGPLGAGKTHLARAIAEGLGIADAALVTSPTFVLIQEYAARLPIYHFDAYRLKGEREFDDLGSGEYFAGAGVCLVEWADRVPGCLPREHLAIHLEPAGASARMVGIHTAGPAYEKCLAELTAIMESQAVPGPDAQISTRECSAGNSRHDGLSWPGG